MLPTKCQQCAKSRGTKVRTECRICADTDFERTVLCELHRAVQQEADAFECHAFAPVLSVAEANDVAVSPDVTSDLRKNPLATQLVVSKLMNSDKIKYQTALTLQKMTEDPEAIIIELKYHFARSVQGRRGIFRDLDKYSGVISEILTNVAMPSVRCAELLWLAPDHLHVYCDSDGENSVEDTELGLKQMLARGLMEKCPEVGHEFQSEGEIWEDSYFVETLDSF